MIEWHDRLVSTMEAAHRLAGGGAPHGAAVAAREQTGGRGRRGRAWASPPGGLWVSVVLRPPGGVAPDGLALRVGVAVVERLGRQYPALSPLAIKWPNDLLLDGRKAGGILSEARWEAGTLAWVVVGIGLNVANALPGALATTAARLADQVPGLTPAALAPVVVAATVAAGRASGPLTTAELEAFARRDWLLNRALREPVTGVARGLARDGALLVEDADGRLQRVTAGDTVELAPRP